MNTAEFTSTLADMLAELVDGAPERGGYVLNSGDPGLLRSLDRLSAETASTVTETGASVASHTDHILYGMSLLNRGAAGENPFQDADWTQSWRRPVVTDAEWSDLRRRLRGELDRWAEVLRSPREVGELEIRGMVGSIAHLAYHLGAIRQIDTSTRGPRAEQA